MKKVLKIDGMGCEHCIKSVRDALSTLDNLNIIEVKLGEAIIEIKEEKQITKVKEVLEDAGYEVM
ncbi:MAG: heavy metal-associated domain-containing protein [Fusobacterium sp.]|uniref:heavy-metal-associated domain-containing protein n=1 Tax=Fusobacterium sp. TaxID=68766 RepID=UPI0026DC664A|nr:heavy metal-associated domain-containing protein [Fusobacterium sp.]MDO4690636.1 heavy metal-associated domain-containing protein [Fusobacterium sp.]